MTGGETYNWLNRMQQCNVYVRSLKFLGDVFMYKRVDWQWTINKQSISYRTELFTITKGCSDDFVTFYYHSSAATTVKMW